MIVTDALTYVHLSLPELHNIITMQPYKSTVWVCRCSWKDRVMSTHAGNNQRLDRI